jgi:hypothetical protein
MTYCVTHCTNYFSRIIKGIIIDKQYVELLCCKLPIEDIAASTFFLLLLKKPIFLAKIEMSSTTDVT